MTPGYDMERLHVALEQARGAVADVQKHKTAQWLTWRLARLHLSLIHISEPTRPS